MVALSVVALVQSLGYTSSPLAAVTNLCVGGWSGTILLLVLGRDPVPRWVLGVDVAVTAVGAVAVDWFARTVAFSSVPEDQPRDGLATASRCKRPSGGARGAPRAKTACWT
jgi:multisubunit Na+/H+ antiporter MnhB subunit